MTIKDFENRIFKGSSFNKWTYDGTQPLEELKKNGYPYSMACFAINTTEIIAFGSERDSQSPRDIIDENQNSNFMVDFNKKPKQMDTMLGHMTVYYAKKV
jgi:hypothetical protein